MHATGNIISIVEFLKPRRKTDKPCWSLPSCRETAEDHSYAGMRTIYGHWQASPAGALTASHSPSTPGCLHLVNGYGCRWHSILSTPKTSDGFYNSYGQNSVKIDGT